MAKSKKRQQKKEQKPGFLNEFSIDKYIPPKYQTVAVIGIILLIFLIYFSPMYFGGKTFESGDIITSKSVASYLDKEKDGYTLWYPHIFCGMPAHGIVVGYKWFNLMYVGIRSLRDLFMIPFSVDYAKWSFYLILLAFTSYLYINHLTKDKLISLFGGITTSLSTGIILFLFIGHVTKLVTLAFYPIIFLILLRFQEKIKLRDFAILIIALQLSIQGFHVQIIFYMLFAIFIYYLFYLIRLLINKNKQQIQNIIKSSLAFAGALIIALLIQSDSLTQIYNYNPYSTRGSGSIVEKESEPKSKNIDSDFYQYATNWSFSPQEIMTFIVPSYYGFGNSKYSGPLTNGREIEVNTYFGQMNSVDLPMYMGILIFVLGLLGIYFNWKKPFIKYLTTLIIISLFISFGRTLPIVYDLMFNYFPFFDKFRVPSMILVLVQLSFPLLAAFGVKSIIDLRKSNNEKQIDLIKYLAYGFSISLVLSFLLNGAISSWFVSRVTDFAAGLRASHPQYTQQFTALSEYIAEMFLNDLLVALFILSVSFWAFTAYFKSKLSANFLVLIVIVLSCMDLGRINNRGAKYNENQNTENLFTKPSYLTFIEQQKNNNPFRLLNLKQDGSLGSLNRNSNFNAHFFVDDLYGYSAIKPRTYQDYIDVVGPVNATMWNMLNVKYIITGRETNLPNLKLLNKNDNEFVYENISSLPRTYFVDSVSISPSIDILNKVKSNSFDPRKVAFVEESDLKIDKPDSNAFVNIDDYNDEIINLNVKATGNNFLFLGDTFYPNGWKAYVDDNETKIYKTNHGFRGIIVPEGNHKVKFEYAPVSFIYSKYISLTLSSLTIVLLILSFIFNNKTASVKPE
ncbi:MAG: YfhO family protein [Ignavibacteria bacterium]|jgi:hypothetical protein